MSRTKLEATRIFFQAELLIGAQKGDNKVSKSTFVIFQAGIEVDTKATAYCENHDSLVFASHRDSGTKIQRPDRNESEKMR